MVSMKDIAERLDLSRCTVSNILNNKLDKYQYAPATVEKVRAAAAEMGYVVNTVARSLKTRRTGTIAVVVADITNAFYTQFISQLQHVCHGNDTALIICASDENVSKEDDILAMLNSRRIDGLIISPVSHEKSLARSVPFPIVQFDRKTKGGMYPFVGVNNAEAASQSVDHLFKAGCRRPLFVGTNRNDYSVQERWKGYVAACANNGLADPPPPIFDAVTAQDAHDQLCAHIGTARVEFDSIFTSTHLLTLGLADALIETDSSVQAMCGFEGFSGSSLLPWKVYNVVQPIAKMTARVFKILEEKINGHDVENETIFNVRTVIC